MKVSNNEMSTNKIVIPNKLVKKHNLDRELYLMLEEDEEYDGKNIFHVRKINVTQHES
jgi:hypothetical protein